MGYDTIHLTSVHLSCVLILYPRRSTRTSGKLDEITKIRFHHPTVALTTYFLSVGSDLILRGKASDFVYHRHIPKNAEREV